LFFQGFVVVFRTGTSIEADEYISHAHTPFH